LLKIVQFLKIKFSYELGLVTIRNLHISGQVSRKQHARNCWHDSLQRWRFNSRNKKSTFPTTIKFMTNNNYRQLYPHKFIILLTQLQKLFKINEANFLVINRQER